MQTYDDAVTEALALTDTPAPLTAADRCDRCPAPAQVRVQLRTGELLFCNHHHAQYAPVLATMVQVPRAL